MVKNFFDGLTETLTKTTKDLGKKANQIYETQKVQSKAASEAHQAEKLQTEIGVLVYGRYKNGETMDEEVAALCEKIDVHMEAIARCKEKAASLKDCKICPSCGKSVDKEVSFCPYCGTPCPTPEPEEEEADVLDETESCDWEAEEPQEATDGAAADAAEPEAEAPAADAQGAPEPEEPAAGTEGEPETSAPEAGPEPEVSAAEQETSAE